MNVRITLASAIATLAMFVFVGCGGSQEPAATPAEANEAYQAAYSAINSAVSGSHAGALQAAADNLNSTINFTYHCHGGGTVELAGMYSPPIEGTANEPTFNLTGDFVDCVERGITMNGNLGWEASATRTRPITIISDLMGTLTFDGGIVVTCEFDVHAELSIGQWTVSGYVCGQTAEEIGVNYSHAD